MTGKSSDRRRDPYAVAGAAGRAAIQRALDTGAPLIAWRALGVFLQYGPLHSRLEDELAVAVVVRATGMDDRTTRAAIQWLRSNKVIDWRPGGSTADGGRRLSTVSFPKVDPGASDPGVNRTGVVQTPGSEHGDPGVIAAETPGSETPPTEKYPEKTTEASSRGELVDRALEVHVRRLVVVEQRKGADIKSPTKVARHRIEAGAFDADRRSLARYAARHAELVDADGLVDEWLKHRHDPPPPCPDPECVNGMVDTGAGWAPCKACR